MKTLIYSHFSLLFLVITLTAFALPSTSLAQERGTSVDFLLNIRAGTCSVADPSIGVVTISTPNDALVYGAPPDRGCVPVLGTSGEQLTLGEFRAVEGRAQVVCVGKGTLVSVHLTGLQPKGVYTVWVPVTSGSPFPMGVLAATALGSVMGDDTFVNNFTASAHGNGQITLIQPAGIGTLAPGPIPGCLLDAALFEVHIAYHLNGQTNGGVPGPPTTWVVQERFIFPHQ